MHIHLDPVGGVAGDMFVAAMLDTWPELAEQTISAVRSIGLDDNVELSFSTHDDGTFTGSRFNVSKVGLGLAEILGCGLDHTGHGHTLWSELRKTLEGSNLEAGIKRHAIGIFSELAYAEACVHGKDVATVAFHEVGNWDSIADIVAAAALINALAPSSWSIGSLPIGSGRVKTAHGELPVPAPATSLLLEGFLFHDDGRPGERVTPTGAAILKYLAPLPGIGNKPRILRDTGFGFGSRCFEGMSNVLRVLAFEANDQGTHYSDTVGLIQFEIDDQTGEELAVSLDHIRAQEGVIDATQTAVMGKKNRMMAGIRILTEPTALDAVCETCFQQTTTLGVRTRIEDRTILARREIKNARGQRVKIARRPGGDTAKTDIDDISMNASGHRARSKQRQISETEALNLDDYHA